MICEDKKKKKGMCYDRSDLDCSNRVLIVIYISLLKKKNVTLNL